MRCSHLIGLGLLLAGGCAQRPCAAPGRPAMTEPWHISTITPGGQASQNGTAILLNSDTGETWFWGCDGHEWIPLKRP